MIRQDNLGRSHRNATRDVDDKRLAWQPFYVATEVDKPKVTPSQILEDMRRLSTRQLESVIEQAALLRLEKRRCVMPARESELLDAINRGLTPVQSTHLQRLEQKLREETISRSERGQLLRLTDKLERLGSQRLKALIELAALRKTTVQKLMHELGLTEAPYA